MITSLQKNVLCNFGRIYTKEQGDYIESKFTGTRFAYLISQSNNLGTVDIYIDNKCVAKDVDLSGKDKPMAPVYVSEFLESEEHIIKIVGKSGTFNLDSFAYWE